MAAGACAGAVSSTHAHCLPHGFQGELSAVVLRSFLPPFFNFFLSFPSLLLGLLYVGILYSLRQLSWLENAWGHKGSLLLRLHPIPPSSGGGVGEGIWRLSTCHSLHAVWSGVPRALMLLPTLHLLLGQLWSDMFHINRMFGHYPISIDHWTRLS